MAAPPADIPTKAIPVTKVESIAALPQAGFPSLIAALRFRQGEAARAIDFTIYTTAGTGITIGAIPRSELAPGTWTVPWDRMKSGSHAALAHNILDNATGAHKRGTVLEKRRKLMNALENSIQHQE